MIDSYLKEFLNKVKALPEFGELKDISPNSKSALGNTPLHIAAIWNDSKAIKILANVVELDVKGEEGYTPLHEAIEQQSMDAIDALVSMGASLEVTNDCGNNALDLSKIFGIKESVFKK
ncbi:MAG: ankyrin repeat domain-containing protein [Verrucomicrobiota bacterium]